MEVNISKFKDKEVPPYGKNFYTVAGANLAILNIDATNITEMTDETADIEKKLDDVVAAENAFKQAVQAKEISRKDFEDCFKKYTKDFQLIEAVTDDLRAALNITIKDMIPSPLVPHQPKDLKAEGSPAGVNILNWKAGENKPGMLYVIESRTADQAEFTMVDMVTATKYKHKNQTPGKFMIFRVKARKGDEYSIPSNEASVYADEM